MIKLKKASVVQIQVTRNKLQSHFEALHAAFILYRKLRQSNFDQNNVFHVYCLWKHSLANHHKFWKLELYSEKKS